MKVDIKADIVHLRFALPRFLYMNGLAVSALTFFRPAGISPRQARKALRSVKSAVTEYGLSGICEFSVTVCKDKEKPDDGQEAEVRVNIVL